MRQRNTSNNTVNIWRRHTLGYGPASQSAGVSTSAMVMGMGTSGMDTAMLWEQRGRAKCHALENGGITRAFFYTSALRCVEAAQYVTRVPCFGTLGKVKPISLSVVSAWGFLAMFRHPRRDGTIIYISDCGICLGIVAIFQHPRQSGNNIYLSDYALCLGDGSHFPASPAR